MSAPTSAASAAEAAPAVTWAQAEKEANDHVTEHGRIYTANIYAANREIMRLAGVDPDGPHPLRIPPHVNAAMREYNTHPFAAYMAITYPGMDRTSNAFQMSDALAAARIWTDGHFTVYSAVGNDLTRPGGFAYLTDWRMNLTDLEKTLAYLEWDVQQNYSVPNLDDGFGSDAHMQSHADRIAPIQAVIPRLRTLIEDRRYPRTGFEASGLGNVAHTLGVPVLHLASFVHPSFGSYPPQRPPRVRTHIDTLNRLRAELAAAMGMGPDQLLDRVRVVKRGLDDLAESVEAKKGKEK